MLNQPTHFLDQKICAFVKVDHEPPQQNRGTKNSLNIKTSLKFHHLVIHSHSGDHYITIYYQSKLHAPFSLGGSPSKYSIPIVLSLQNGWHLITLEILRGVFSLRHIQLRHGSIASIFTHCPSPYSNYQWHHNTSKNSLHQPRTSGCCATVKVW